MKWALGTLVTVAAFSAGVILVTHEPEPVETVTVVPEITEVEHPVVWRMYHDLYPIGTAFPIHSTVLPNGLFETTFLTAGHCIEEGVVYGVDTGDGTLVAGYGQFGKRHPQYEGATETDLGLFRVVSQDKIDVFELHWCVPEFGDAVFSIGFPATYGPYIVDGHYCGEGRISANGFPGSSGSPVFAEDGCVVGVYVAVFAGGFDTITFMGIMAPLDREWILSQL